ncbi:Cyclin, N-terminal domain [Ceratobasidium sp. AG-Ba]|nr:Cyclin, N-terminal domain [Ceratobasidium sp. AG-Ba]
MLKTPSAVHGCSMEEELSARQKGIELLLRVAGQLRLPVNAFVAAASYFHRFYMRNSIKDYNYRTNGNLKPDTDLQVLENSKEHKKWTENILVYEETLLDSLCFDLVTESPHACLATTFSPQDLGSGKHEIFDFMSLPANLDEKQLDSIALNAWGIAHDTLRIPICLFYTAKVIAAACFLISLVSCPDLSSSLEWTDFPSPFDRYLSTDPPMVHWLERFALGSGDIQQIADCIFIMLYFYRSSEPNERVQSPIPYQQLAPPTLASVQWPPIASPQSSQEAQK